MISTKSEITSPEEELPSEDIPLEHSFNVKVEGDLVGWLIRFREDRRGISTELRSGRFFIGSQKLRSHDIVISDKTVSTPHCIATASSAEGLFVQDLMSEGGTYLRRAGQDKFIPVQNIASVGHGDWLKLGAYEVMVCLLPSSAKG